MKKVINNSNAKNNVFAKFSKAVISKKQQQMVKGGSGDSIIVEEVLQG